MQFNRGTSAMQHYVATRPMFIDVKVMNSDTRLVLGDQGSQASPSNVARGLSSLYKEITGWESSYIDVKSRAWVHQQTCCIFVICPADTVRKEAATIMAVFPSPNDVMSILVQVPWRIWPSCSHVIELQQLICSTIMYTYFLVMTGFLCHMQRVLEQRITALLDKLLVKPSLVNPPPIEEGGLLLVSKLVENASIFPYPNFN